MDMTDLQDRQVGSFLLRERRPPGPGPHRLILLLHGWTGDESSMWLFTPRLPGDAWLVAPRGLHPASRGGYAWHSQTKMTGGNVVLRWPWLEDFRPAADALIALLIPENFPGAQLETFDVVGFSQGAALAYALALFYPERVRAVAGLAGFLPDGAAAFLGSRQPLRRGPAAEPMPVYVSHGTLDNLVPVEMARRSIELLQQAGAEVVFCEDDVGHRLSADCFRSLEHFFLSLSGS
jgi:phospholipase/carboxylesterase